MGADRSANEAGNFRCCGARVWYYDGGAREYGDEEKWRCVDCGQL